MIVKGSIKYLLHGSREWCRVSVECWWAVAVGVACFEMVPAVVIASGSEEAANRVLQSSSVADETVKSIVGSVCDGIVARSTAIYSARVDFEYSESRHKVNSPAVQKTIAQRAVFSVQGDDWVLRYPDSENFHMTRQQACVVFSASKDPKTGAIFRTLQVEAPMSLRELMEYDESCRVLRVGSLPWIQQVTFVQREQANAKYAGKQFLSGIECEVLEWIVRKDSFGDAFVTFPAALANEVDACLRLYVSPKLGFSLVRMEYRSGAGVVLTSWESEDFQEIAAGLHVPFKTTLQARTGISVLNKVFTVREWTHLNQKLPDYTFSLHVPHQTRVRDSRPGVPPTVFTLTSQQQFDALNRALAPVARESTGVSWRNGILLMNVTILMCLLAYWTYFRCCMA